MVFKRISLTKCPFSLQLTVIPAQTVDVNRNVDWTVLELCALVVIITPVLLTVLSLATVSNAAFATLYGDARDDGNEGKRYS